MINVRIICNTKDKTIVAPENSTVEEALERSGLPWQGTELSLNGLHMDIDDLSKTFTELNLAGNVNITSLTKLALGATVTVMENAVLVKSDIDYANWKKIQKIDPDKLSLKDENGNEKFTVFFSAEDELGEIDNNGIMFVDAPARDGKAYAHAAVDIPEGVDTKDFILDEIGTGLMKLNMLEDQVKEYADDIGGAFDSLKGSITIL